MVGTGGLQVRDRNWAALPMADALHPVFSEGLAARSDSRKAGVAPSHRWTGMLGKLSLPVK
jgi:hypothetical protein